MSEEQDLKKARDFIAENNKSQASIILWRLYQSHNLKIKLDTILSLLVILNHFTENEKLLEITEEGLKITSVLNNKDVEAYLLAEKCNFLINKIGFMIYRQKNLKLSANVFKWISFSTEQEKNEFETITQQRKNIEQELQRLEIAVSDIVKNSKNYYFRGSIFLRLGDFYSSKFLNDQLDTMIGGKMRSKIGNIYFVRRWNLGRWFLYKNEDRKKIKDDWDKCIYFFKSAISDFKSGGHNGEMAHAYYNFAIKYKTVFQFRKSKKLLEQAQKLAERCNEKRLLSQITLFRKELTDRNKNIRNYVEEYGLDLH
ncbi:MAG: hypothetical protein ABIA74_03315 [bacterium]